MVLGTGTASVEGLLDQAEMCNCHHCRCNFRDICHFHYSYMDYYSYLHHLTATVTIATTVAITGSTFNHSLGSGELVVTIKVASDTMQSENVLSADEPILVQMMLSPFSESYVQI